MPPTSCQAQCIRLPSTRLPLLATITAHQSLSRHHHHPSSPPPCHPAIRHPPAAIRHPSPTIRHHCHPSSLPSIITAVIITSIRHHGQHHHHQRHHQYRYIPTHPLKPTHRQHHHLRRSSPCAPTLTTYSNPHPTPQTARGHSNPTAQVIVGRIRPTRAWQPRSVSFCVQSHIARTHLSPACTVGHLPPDSSCS